MRKIMAGIIGAGFISLSHLDAIRRIGFADIVGITDVNYELAKKKADEYGIPKCYRSVEELLADGNINVVHNCTPNHLHLEINKKIIKAGKHVFSEKPLAMNTTESQEMLDLVNEHKELVHGVNFNYRMNPLVQDIKHKISNGEIGTPKLIHGSYLQDWLLFDTDYNWRLEPEIGGASRCIADIGSHWMDMAQTVTGAKITEVCADLVIVLPVRKKTKSMVETFSQNTDMEYEEKEIKTEDYGAVLFKMDNGCHGVFHASEVSAGRKCYLNIEVNGTKASLYWNQENADHMWMGFREQHNMQIMRNPLLVDPKVQPYTYLASGHPEGWNDAIKNNIYSFYKFIVDGKEIGKDSCDFATFKEGHYILKLTEAILESNKDRKWVKLV